MTSLMQRKVRNGRDAYAARAMSLQRALRLTAAKQAEKMMGLALGVLGVTRKTLGGDEVAQQLDLPWLTMLMDGPAHRVAAVMIDPVLATGLIQQQTMGKMIPAPEGGEQRPPTPTDASLCAPFVETLLSSAALLPETASERGFMEGYRFGILAAQPRHAQLALDRASYEVIEMTLDLALGTRTGQLRIILPEPVQVVDPERGNADPLDKPVGKNTLSNNVMSLNAELVIALTRLKLPLQQVSSMKAGDVVPLNLLNMTKALVLDANGVAISRGTLGQIEGMRALQVEQPLSHRHTQPRRRGADRAELDLPDVTAPHIPAHTSDLVGNDEEGTEHVVLPMMSDVDIFGDIDDLPDIPDLEDAAKAADAIFDAQENEQSMPQPRRAGDENLSAMQSDTQAKNG